MTNKSDICGVSLCSKLVENGIQCDRCGRWYHERCSLMTKQCYLLHQKHKELKWVCNHCVALAEECSRILMGAIAVKPTDGKSFINEIDMKSSRGQMAAAEGQMLPQETETKSIRGRSKKSKKRTENRETNMEKKNPQTGVLVQTKVDNGLQARVELLEKQIREIQQSTQVLLSRTKNVLLHNLAEPLIRDAKARREADKKRVQDIFRLAGMPPTTPIIKYHRVGMWKEAQITKPRPLLVVFPSTHARDMLLARAYMVQVNTCGNVIVTPDEGIHKQLHVPEIASQETKTKGTLQVKLNQVPSTHRVTPLKADLKKKSMPQLKGVGGSPISKSTPQKKNKTEQLEKGKKGGIKESSSKTVAPKVETKITTEAEQLESLGGRKCPDMQPDGKTEKTVSPDQGLGQKSWADVVRTEPKLRLTPHRVSTLKGSNSVSLNTSETFVQAYSNVEMTRGGCPGQRMTRQSKQMNQMKKTECTLGYYARGSTCSRK